MAQPGKHRKSLGDEMRPSEGIQIAASGPTASGTLKIGARRGGWKANQGVDEIDTARRFASSTGREWTILEKQPEDSDVELTLEEVVRLIEKAVSKKMTHYPVGQRKNTILLIDLVPGGMLPQFAA